MIDKLIDVYITWHFKRSKLTRVLLKTLGFTIAFATVPIWLPLLFVAWFVLSIIIGIFEFIEKA